MAIQLTITRGKNRGKEFVFDGPTVRIGRLPNNDLVLYDTGVSRLHCTIQAQGDGFVLLDAGSSNGTSLNGRRTGEAALQNGDRIGVGPIIFEVHIGKTRRAERRGKPRDDDRAVARPANRHEALHIEEQSTVALTAAERARELDLVAPVARRSDTTVDPNPNKVARTRTRRQIFPGGLAALPRSTRIALIAGSSVLVVAIVVSVWMIVGRPPPDRSAQIFRVSGENALKKFGFGRVNVSTPDRANFKFDYKGGRVTINFAAAGIESSKELEVQINGKRVGFVEKTAGWTRGLSMRIPRRYLLKGSNVLTFDNTLTPARTERWGISQLQVLQEELPVPDKEKADQLYKLGVASFDTRSVAPQNLYKSIEYLEQAELYLEALDQPPALLKEIRTALRRSQEELSAIHNTHMFTAQKEYRFGNRAAAVDALQELLRYYPDPRDRRHKDIKTRLTRLLAGGRPQ